LEITEEHKVILRRLYFDGVIGERHTSVVHLKKGIPPKYRNSIDKSIKDLYRYGYLVPKKTSYGEQVSLNKHMIPEIEGILGIEP
jgi:hypothetical protein